MVIQNAINNLITSQAANRVYGIDRRQCISASNGNFVTITNVVDCTIVASVSVPIVCTFAAGFDSIGVPIDYIGSLSNNQTLSNLATGSHYLYLERNATTGALTCNKTTIVPIYSNTAPVSPATGQHWFKTFTDSLTSQQGYKMYEWSGSVWVVRQRVFIGQAIDGNGAGISSLASYATNRKYQSAWIDYNSFTLIAISHNFGMTLAEAEATWTAYGRSSSADLTATFVQMLWAQGDGVNFYGMQPREGNRLSHTFVVQPSGLYVDNSGVQVVTGQVQIAISSGW